VGHHALSDLMLQLANGSLDSAPVRVVDVDILMSDCRVIRGYPSRIALAKESSLVLTSHGAMPTMGEDTTVDLEEAIWACAAKSDGATDTFGADKAELVALLTESYDGARSANQFGAEVAVFGIALGVVAQAYGDPKLANRHYRDACAVLGMAQGNDRAIADVWIRIAETYRLLGQKESAKVAYPQAVSFYEHVLGAEHPITKRAQITLQLLG
jgi:hypothetical protein